MNEDLLSLLQQHWHYQSFRPQQEEIMRSVLEGKDTLALLPTGGGKSLCFQLPTLARPGLCLVVSPLIALMKEQTDSLRKKNITAFFLHTGMSRKEIMNTLKTAGDSNCKFLYVSPERLETDLLISYLPALDVRLIAVDEAHCVSQWGYDFRPSYLRIAALRALLPDVPLLALTASATPTVLKDIVDKLELKNRPFSGSLSPGPIFLTVSLQKTTRSARSPRSWERSLVAASSIAGPAGLLERLVNG